MFLDPGCCCTCQSRCSSYLAASYNLTFALSDYNESTMAGTVTVLRNATPGWYCVYGGTNCVWQPYRLETFSYDSGWPGSVPDPSIFCSAFCIGQSFSMVQTVARVCANAAYDVDLTYLISGSFVPVNDAGDFTLGSTSRIRLVITITQCVYPSFSVVYGRNVRARLIEYVCGGSITSRGSWIENGEVCSTLGDPPRILERTGPCGMGMKAHVACSTGSPLAITYNDPVVDAYENCTPTPKSYMLAAACKENYLNWGCCDAIDPYECVGINSDAASWVPCRTSQSYYSIPFECSAVPEGITLYRGQLKPEFLSPPSSTPLPRTTTNYFYTCAIGDISLDLSRPSMPATLDVGIAA